MTATREEALEQGWLEPAPTFFADDLMIYLSKCHDSPWVLVRRTVPKPVLNYEHPVVQAVLAGRADRRPRPSDKFLLGRVPTLYPRPRPFMYIDRRPLRRITSVWLRTCFVVEAKAEDRRPFKGMRVPA